MSAVTMETGTTQTTAYGGLIDAIGGIAAGVLAIIGLNGFDPEGMAGIATIVLGAAFLVQAGSILSEYTHILQRSATGTGLDPLAGADGLTPMFVVGAAGIVLGVLALLGIASAALTAIAVIAFGSCLLLSSGSMRQLYVLRREALLGTSSTTELLAGQMASGSSGIQLLSGLSAIVLGILAVAGHSSRVLTLAALLVLGATVLLSGSALSSLVMSFMQESRPSSQVSTNRSVR